MLVYRYGLSAPIGPSADLVYDQLRAAHRYRNDLVQIERARRAACRDVLFRAAPEIGVLTAGAAEAEEAVLKIVDAIKKERASTRKRSESSTLKQELKEARAKRWTLVSALRDARFKLKTDPAVEAEMGLIGERAAELRRGARALTDTYWGTYLMIEDEMTASAKMPLYDKDGVSPNDPRFQRWTGEGSLGVQVQGGAPAADVMSGKNLLLRLQPDERAYLRRACDRRRIKEKTGMLDLRVGTDDKRAPIWASWHLDMHRLLPEQSTVKRAAVHVRRVAWHSEWYLTVTIDGAPLKKAEESTKVIAIDVGWRVIGDELRVAGWKDSDGQSGDIRLSAKTIALLRRSEELRSERDHHFGLAKLRLVNFLAKSESVPDWLRVETVQLERWGSADRLSRLFVRWDGVRFTGDAAVYNDLMAWYWRDRHLAMAEASMRNSSLARRRCFYRETAAHLAQTYGVIVLEQFDLRQVILRPAVDEGAENMTARSNRQLVAVSELRTALIQAGATRGRTVAAVDRVNTTRTCPVCGLIEKRDAEASVTLVCECGASWDQDVGGAPVVLLQRWREHPGDAKILAGARTGEKANGNGEEEETRWGKARRMAAEKKKRKGGARKEGPEDAV